MGLIDKTARATVKTSTGLVKASEELIRKTGSTAIDLTVNFTPDIYDQHQDFTKGTALTIVGNSTMVARDIVRAERSVRSFAYKGAASWKKSRIKKRRRAIGQTQNQLNHYESLQKKLDNTGNYSGIQQDGITNRYVKSRRKTYQNQIVDLKNKKKRLELKQKRYLNKSKKLKAKGLNPMHSLKRTFSNQTRKATSVLKNKDDIGTKSIGLTMKGVWAGIKFKRRAKGIVKTVTHFLSAVLGAIMSFIISIPAIVTSLISMLPVIIVIIVIVAILSPIISTSYSGRIGTLYLKINELNKIYEVEIEAAQVLAITDVLEWTTQDEEQFEQLYSLMLDQKKGNKLSFDQMAINVFIKYHPVNQYKEDGVYDKKMKTGYHYWSLEGLDLNFIIDNSVQRNLLYQEHIKLYPTYQRAGKELLKKMKTSNYQQRLIREARDRIKVNEKRYEDYIYEYHLGDIDINVTGDNEKGLAIAKKALTKLGCVYIWGAGHGKEYQDPSLKYFDCSGLVNWSFYQSGINIGDQTTKTLLSCGKNIPKSSLQAGDLILFSSNGQNNGVHHVGIYVGNNKMIHAPSMGDVVKIVDLDSRYYKREAFCYKRLY